MENLQSRLKKAQEKALSETTWSAFDAATLVLNDFREKVRTNSLAIVNDGVYPRYEFSINDVVLPKDSKIQLSNWLLHKDYVLNIIRTSTGMDANCCWPGPVIELRPRTEQAEQAESAKGGLWKWDPILGDLSPKNSQKKSEGIWQWLFNAR